MRIEEVDRIDDPRVDAYRNLRDSELRARAGLFLAEGRLNVERLIRDSPYRTHSVLVTATALEKLRPVFEGLGTDTPVYRATRGLMEQVSGVDLHRGCIAAGERSVPPPLDVLLARAAQRGGPVVVLEDLADADNVGSIFRSAHAFGAPAVLLSERCVDPLYRRAIRVSMGASLRLPFVRAGSCTTLLGALEAAGFESVALCTERDALPLAEAKVGARVALWLGSEGPGLSADALARIARRVTIPMQASADSLNVATAAAIALHHFQDWYRT